LTASLIEHFGQIGQLQVISQNGVRPFRGDSIRIDSIARSLDVGTIIGGSVVQSGDRLRVTVEMTKAPSGVLVGSKTFERPIGELFALLDDMSREVATYLRGSLGAEIKLQAYRSETNNVQAWQAVQRKLIRVATSTVRWMRPRLRSGAMTVVRLLMKHAAESATCIGCSSMRAFQTRGNC
jgi:hypothetical protein